MKKALFILLFAGLLTSCKDRKKGPDISGIKADIRIERFDQSFFAIDSNNIAGGLRSLQQKHPAFYTDFMQNILGVSGADTSLQTLRVTADFLRGYRPVQEKLSAIFSDTKDLQQDLEKAFRYVKYYFPRYQSGTITLFTGPFDAPGVASTNSGIAFGLQQYAGAGYPEYKSPVFQEMFPAYISRRFSKEYMTANAMKAVVEDLFPDRSEGRPLIEQMIEKGKRWYLLDLLMPDSPDSLKTGYTQKQLDWCKTNEGMIWSYLVKNEDLNSLSPVVIQTYIGEGPFTQGMPQDFSPGNIGQWIGRQIIRKYMGKNKNLTPEELMRTAPATINEVAKYKPK